MERGVWTTQYINKYLDLGHQPIWAQGSCRKCDRKGAPLRETRCNRKTRCKRGNRKRGADGLNKQDKAYIGRQRQEVLDGRETEADEYHTDKHSGKGQEFGESNPEEENILSKGDRHGET